MDARTIGKRVQAARLVAGYERREDFTPVLQLPRFGPKTLGAVERGARELFEHEAQTIARISGLELAFFGFDSGQPQGDDILRMIRRVLKEQSALLEDIRTTQGRIAESLASLPEVAKGLDDLLRLLEEERRRRPPAAGEA